jgi:hypothetical protein
MLPTLLVPAMVSGFTLGQRLGDKHDCLASSIEI